MKTSNLVIKNSSSRENDSLSESNVIYKFSCHVMPCKADYIGLTRTKLKKLQVNRPQKIFKIIIKQSRPKYFSYLRIIKLVKVWLWTRAS